ncbi:MAG: Smr/MutS family protein [Mucinivorans sp.]
MVYPHHAEQQLGFDSVRADIAASIETDGGRQILADMQFSDSYDVVRQSVERVAQMVALLWSSEEFPARGYVDINHFLPKINIEGGFIEQAEMLTLGKALGMINSVASLFNLLAERGAYGELTRLTADLAPMGHIEQEINRILDKFGNVRDGASSELQTIRRSLADKSSQISRRLLQILHQAQADGYAEADSSVAIRDGRAVIPVAASNKRKIKGYVFDESASGRTAYIEPLEVIELNNEVNELKSDERHEIVRILMNFSIFLRPYTGDLQRVGSLMCYLDFLTAKARYALSIGGVKPIIEPSTGIYLRSARHPLLEKVFTREGRKSSLVPLDIRLTSEKHILLISGPNAGGKSVCLKTVGLLQMMLQCGLLVPVLENSEMGIFDSVFIDIGDEQSIENDLSTYSSHLANMKTMLREATCSSLVLIDEFGGGTEPTVGGAIAESVLEQFVARGVFGVITTHYSNLKNYASTVSGIENGAMTFDVQKIKPLYRLEMGRSGSSFAFEIARKIGLPEDVLQSATDKIGVDQVSLDKQLRQAARDKRYWEAKRDKIRLENKSAERLAEEYEAQLQEIKSERSLLIKAAKEEAKTIVKNANALIESTIREIKEAAAQKERTQVVRQKVESFRQSLSDTAPGSLSIDPAAVVETVDDRIAQKIEQLRAKEARRQKRSAERQAEPALKVVAAPKVVIKPPIEVGSTVRMAGVSGTGTVLSLSGGRATVALGGLSTLVDVKKLEVISSANLASKSKPAISTVANSVLGAALDFSNQIDVRGMRVVEGLDVVRDFVDRSIMVGQRRITILHGKGTGALKEEIRRYLRSEPAVRSAIDEKEEFGGAGITVVEFDFD